MKAQDVNELLNTLLVELMGYQQQLTQTIKFAHETEGFEITIKHLDEKLSNVNRVVKILLGEPDARQPL